MHIPDGILDAKTLGVTAVLAVAGVGAAVFHANRTLPARKVPLLGVSAAFLFAAQLINFPIWVGPASGHLIGSTLVAILLGPSAAIIVLAAVLITQSLLFGDGGVMAIGANMLNMGILSTVAGYAVYRGISRLHGSRTWNLASAGAAAWVATMLAALCCGGQLAASGVSWVVIPAMAGWHALIGIGEAVLTMMILASVSHARPDLARADTQPSRSGYAAFAAYGLCVALALSTFVSPWASALPDGLERVARDHGFAAAEREHAAPMNDYALAVISSPATSAAVAAGAGTIVVFGGSLLMARALGRRRTDDASEA